MRKLLSGEGRRTIYYSIAAQQDNLGDVDIRRVVYSWLTATGNPIRIFVGTMPASYIEAIGLRPEDQQFQQSWRFQMALIRDVLQRRAHLVFAPGPQSLTIDRQSRIGCFRSMVKSPLKSTVNTTNSLLVKISGGKVVSIGRAIRGDHPAALALERFRASLSDHFSVRDTISGTVIRRNVERVPDVAFAGGIEHDVAVERSLIAVSWRGDRRVPDEAIAFVVDAVRSRGLEPVFVTQVKSDDPRHVELAAKFHCEVVSWDDQSHVEQAIRVERTYRACRIILSDRLHGLIFGARSGAIPVAYVHRDSDKLTSTLEDLMPLSIMTESPDTWQSIIKAVEGEPKLKDVQSAVAKAQARVEETGKSIVSLLAGRSSQLEQSR